MNCQRLCKRAFDVLAAGGVLTIAAPVLALCSLLIVILMGRPVLFRQRRAGLNGRPFTIYKLRTMADGRDAEGRLLPDSSRLTRLGCLLRKLSLDELPQLWNVIRGDMSLVGPRPLLLEYLPRYNKFQSRRHDVLPGLTGWAQINGRNLTSWDERFALDIWYVDNWSVWLDGVILLRTIVQVIRPIGVSAHRHATMPEFRGTAD